MYQTGNIPFRLCDVRLVVRNGDRDVIVEYREQRRIPVEGSQATGSSAATAASSSSSSPSSISSYIKQKLRMATVIPGTDVPITSDPSSSAETSSTANADASSQRDQPFKKHDSDTEIADVETVSEFPEFTTCPMPPSVLDELRGKYSRFRVRHDQSLITKLENVDRWEATQKDLRERSVLTPLQELIKVREMEKLQREKAEVLELDEEMLVRIGRVMVAEGSKEKLSVVKGLSGLGR